MGMIPAQAVEAAEEAVFAALLSRGLEGRIDGYEQIARAALEAAAPYMTMIPPKPEPATREQMAAAWDEGYAAESDYAPPVNPYRTPDAR